MRRTRLSALALCAAGALVLPTAFEATVRSASPAPAASRVSLSDATTAAGIRFKHNSGAFGKKYLPETMGAGVLFVDLDGDGWPDLLFVNSKNWPGRPGPASLPAFYRNDRDGTFTDVTRGSGLDVSTYGLGGAAADYDNDGRVDVYLTGLGGNRLFHNEGNGRFADVTAKAGAGGGGFGTSAAFFDYDK
ncbi:MAG TPA: VCBS repeat-containing protein, partial [Vicinamibacteria bacterium]